ncbi:MAG: Methyltransferase type 12 [Candidatus Collierbacteria bacterium GW2011_GWC2_44_18]|uniref:Methyltransferase type 12 n=2 Tax=Microgenomates group TaxID=1794810 RepID=A0A0G1J930_9BACT|nr:MAG: methyltransferase family protein [Microgenomates group bacterium GW2011_GWC1_44_10]KKT49532.1 MAG: Methyltransferase type 12 [Candidatus Collierbacteria bacterium GW2011_GWC2_44_18]KKT67770.1 MAG: Methyltransferase type 12 [Candidatus Woesebacteria bacterium GW2011_GWA2_44_33]
MKKEKWSDASHRILEQATGLHRYNHWLISHFDDFFGQAILEIGSGQGALSRLLPSKAIVILSDIIPEYLEGLKRSFTDPVLNLDIEKEAPIKLMGKMDTIFSSNVFEHIKNDNQAFANCYKLLASDGQLLLFVPARPEIYGKMDEAMGHYRRYTKTELKTKALKAGFKIKHIYYANWPGYFLWWGRGMFGSSKSDNFFAKVFDSLIVPLLYLEKHLHPPFGQSLVLIVKKP